MFRRLAKRAFHPFRQQLRWWGVLSIAVATWSLPASTPWADETVDVPFCDAARDEIFATLAAQFDEQLTVSLIDTNGVLIEVTASSAGAWTLLTTVPGGPTCVQGAGEGFRLWPLAARS